MSDAVDIGQLHTGVIWAGLGLGALFGAVAQKTNFCTMGAVSDVVNMGSWGRMRAWLLAIATAILLTQIGAALSWFDLGKTLYSSTTLNWGAHIVGGLLFGVGMTLASGCGNKTLLRAASGNLKSVVVIAFVVLAALMTMRGALAPLRVGVLQADGWAIELPAAQSIPLLLSSGSNTAHAQMICGLGLGGLLLVAALWTRNARRDRENLIAGVVLGALVAAGWWVTGHWGYAENPDTLEMLSLGTASRMAESLTFIGPLAGGADLLMRWTDTSLLMSWGVATVCGVFCGALAVALITKSFRWEGFQGIEDMARHLVGATLMGFGGVTAGGCTIGQGITGVSTLALGGIITLVGIIAGCTLTLKIEYARLMRVPDYARCGGSTL
jgi:uncharacterized membrane protein YedE/YeeE